MNRLFLASNLLLFSCAVFAQVSYKDISVTMDKNYLSDQAMCISSKGTIAFSLVNPDGTVAINAYDDASCKTFSGTNYSVATIPHELIALKGGGYALGGRNLFAIVDEALVTKKAIGTKMTDWRASDYSSGTMMDKWKLVTSSATTTAVDFLELAESPNGNYVCGLFLWHAWSGNRADLQLGLAIADMTQGAKVTIHDLNQVIDGSSMDSPTKVADYVEMAFLDDKNVVIGYTNGAQDAYGQEMAVWDVPSLAAGGAYTARLWKGKMHKLEGLFPGIDGFFVENGVLYYALGDQGKCILGKAKWDGSQLVVQKTNESTTLERPDILCNLNSEYFLIAGIANDEISSLHRQPYFQKIKKSDMSYGGYMDIISSGADPKNTRSGGVILDVYPLNAANMEIVVLMRGRYDDKDNPGPFYLTTVQLSK